MPLFFCTILFLTREIEGGGYRRDINKITTRDFFLAFDLNSRLCIKCAVFSACVEIDKCQNITVFKREKKESFIRR